MSPLSPKPQGLVDSFQSLWFHTLVFHSDSFLKGIASISLHYLTNLLVSSVLCHCQIHGIPAVLYQNYSDVISADSVTMEAYKLALSWTKSVSRYSSMYLHLPLV